MMLSDPIDRLNMIDIRYVFHVIFQFVDFHSVKMYT